MTLCLITTFGVELAGLKMQRRKANDRRFTKVELRISSPTAVINISSGTKVTL
jgi:hypothetical protein